jgi:hypothetical protein
MRWRSWQQAFDAALSREVAGRPESAGAFAQQLVAAIDGWTPKAGGAVAASAGRPNRTVPLQATPTVVDSQAVAAASSGTRGGRAGIIAAVVAVIAVGGYFAYRSFAGAPSASIASSVTGPASDSAKPESAPASVAPAPVDNTPATPNGPNAVQIAAAVRDSIARESAARARRDSLQKISASKSNVAAPPTAPGPTPSTPRVDSARANPPAPPPTASPTSAELPLRDSLTTLAAGLKPGIDRVTAGRIADALRKLAPRITDPSLRATAYFRLIDASAKSGGDIDDMCASYRAAKSAARGDAQLAELRRFEQRLGCS